MTDEHVCEASPIQELTVVEIELLEALVTEPSMARVARRIGYSDRQTRRLAQRLVERLGVANKYAAVAKAARSEIIGDRYPGMLAACAVPHRGDH